MAPATVFVRLIIILSFFTCIEGVTYSIPFILQTTCNGNRNQYFDIAGLRCRDCDASKIQSANGLACQCRSSLRTVKSVGGPPFSLQCEACASSQVTTSDGWNCINQPSPECAANQISEEYLPTGAVRTTKVCTECTAGTMPDVDGLECIRCHQSFPTVAGGCLCSDPNELVGDICVPVLEVKRPAQNTFRVAYEAVDTPVQSSFFARNLQAAEAMCRLDKNLTACQLLGNLCVLQNYDPNSDACIYFEAIRILGPSLINDNADWVDYMPWLSYSVDAADDILSEINIPTKYSAQQTSQDSTLKLNVAQYSATGQYRGLTSVNGGVIQLCKDTVPKMDAAYTFATTYTSSCPIKAQDLWNNYETVFFDMYLEYTQDNTNRLYAIPVLLDNYKDGGGTLVNQRTLMTGWELTRRFFLVDNVSGKTSSNAPATVIRYASSIELLVTLQNVEGETREGKIYPPLLKITYSDLVYEDDYDSNTEVTVSFRVTYEMNRDFGETALSTALGVMSGIGVIWALVRSNAWRRRAGLIYIDVKTMFKFLFFGFGMLANVFFVCIFGTCLYWFFFFKRQDLVYLVIPTADQEVSFIWYLCFAFICKSLEILHLVVYQCLADVFLIDWERSRGRVVQSSDPGANTGTVAPVSIWRTFFVANEWNEIQATRRSNIFFQMMAMLFFLEVIGMKHLTTMDPRTDVYYDPSEYTGPYSRVLRFAVAAGMYLLLGLVQWIFFSFIYERFVEDSMRNFVDLCSMANISVFILIDSTFGYYIHGRSVHGFADTDLKEMRTQLKREEDNLCGQRGLLPNSEQQTFEMLLPSKFRDQYNAIIQPLDGVAARIDGTRGRPDAGRNQEAEKSIQAYQTMNRFLAAFLDHGIRDIDYMVKDKLLLEQILDMEFYDPTDKGFFYNDGGHSFDNSLFYGNESTLQLFELLLFCLVDLIATNFVLAAIITYIGSRILFVIRAAGGRANLAKKTLVDERFLI